MYVKVHRGEKVANIQEQIGNLKDETWTDEPNVNVRNDHG